MLKKERLLTLLNQLTRIVNSFRIELEDISAQDFWPVEEADRPLPAEKMEALRKRHGTGKNSNNALNLHPDYTFENFVVDKSNRLAHAACLTVAEMPGKSYNPLFIYGDQGVGKTHLLHAIMQRLIVLKPEFKVTYLSSRKFIKGFIAALVNETLRQFREELCGVDMLLVDDVQLLNGNENARKGFFHIIEALYEKGCQIVLAADCAPSDMKGMTERLTQRFSWGLAVGIQAHDEALRAEIPLNSVESRSRCRHEGQGQQHRH